MSSNPDSKSSVAGGVGLSDGAQRVLAVLTRRAPLRLSWPELTRLAGLLRTGRYLARAVRELRGAGLIEELRGRVWASETAIAEAGRVDASARSRADIVAEWCGRLPTPAPAILRRVASHRPATAKEVAASIGLKPSGQGWVLGLATLRVNGLIEVVHGELQLSKRLGDEIHL